MVLSQASCLLAQNSAKLGLWHLKSDTACGRMYGFTHGYHIYKYPIYAQFFVFVLFVFTQTSGKLEASTKVDTHAANA